MIPNKIKKNQPNKPQTTSKYAFLATVIYVMIIDLNLSVSKN